MRIVVDLQACQSGSRHGGIGRYSLDLFKAMVSVGRDHDIIAVLNERLMADYDQIGNDLASIIPVDNIRIFKCPDRISYFSNLSKRTVAAELLREKFIYDLNPDVVHVCSVVEGLGDDVVTSVSRSGTVIPTAATLYDLIPAQYPDLYLTDHIARQHYIDKLNVLRQADLLLSISQYTIQEFSGFFPDYRGNLVNISGGFDQKFNVSPARSGSFDVFKIRNKLGRFVLYTASYDQRKNQVGLIEAFASLPPDIRNGLKLVFVGNGWPDVYNKLYARAAQVGVNRSEIVFAGKVTDDVLIDLYRECELFVFPSFAEGLGLPILEAMACGAPVIGSNTTCIPEVLGNSDALFDPRDVASIGNKMCQALSDTEFRAGLRSAGIAHAARFTWRRSAEAALFALEDLVRERQCEIPQSCAKLDLTDAVVQKLPAGLSSDEYLDIFEYIIINEIETDADWVVQPTLHLGWVSTWETRCGIATYSDHLTTNMSATIHKLGPIDGGNLEDDEKSAVQRCWKLGLEDDFFDLSANIIESGVAAVIVQVNYGFFSFERLAAFLELLLDRDISVFVTLHSTIDPPQQMLPNKLSDMIPTLACLDGVFVHSKSDLNRLRQLGLGPNLILLPHGIRNVPMGPASVEGRRRVASYGFFLPQKGLTELIEAAAIAKRNGRGFELLLVNSDYGDEGGFSKGLIQSARGLAKQLGVGDEVIFVDDFLDDNTSLSLLRTADLIVFAYQNTNESASGAVRFGLASGKPVAVTDLAIFDDVRAVTHTLPGKSPAEMEVGISQLLIDINNNSDNIAEVKYAATHWISQHDYRRIQAFILRKIRRCCASSWKVVAKPDIMSLPTLVGERIRGRVRSSGREGTILYGPYLHLMPGRYKLVLNAVGFGDSDKQMRVRVTSSGGGRLILQSEYLIVAGDMEIETTFKLLAETEGFEVVVTAPDGAVFEIIDYAIFKK